MSCRIPNTRVSDEVEPILDRLHEFFRCALGAKSPGEERVRNDLLNKPRKALTQLALVEEGMGAKKSNECR